MAATAQAFQAALDVRLDGVRPSTLVAVAVAASAVSTAAAVLLWQSGRDLADDARSRGWLQVAIDAAKRHVPFVGAYVERKKRALVAKLETAFVKPDSPGDPVLRELPATGMDPTALLALLESRRHGDVTWSAGRSPLSGAAYSDDPAHATLLVSAYAALAHANPLHGDAWPSVARLEREVIAMTASLLGGPEALAATGEFVCGVLTSGGTESLLTAVRAARQHASTLRGITRPELVVASSAHAALDKASAYYGLRLVRVPCRDDGTADVAAMCRAITRNTALVVASAPSYPHGVLDDVAAIAAAAAARGVWCHVDACLGGYVLPFLPRSGPGAVPAFDFRVPGVWSLSADVHKYGLAHKGASVLLFRSRGLRKLSFTAVTQWSGGLYVTPSQAGSRSAGLIAQAWAAMMAVGRDGYARSAATLMRAAADVAAGVGAIPGLAVIGSPVMCVVAFTSTDPGVDIYAVNDAMGRAGWHLNALQSPPAVHVCLTLAHAKAVPKLLVDLAASVAAVRADPGSRAAGMAPIYGTAASVPDRGAVGDLLVTLQDLMSQ